MFTDRFIKVPIDIVQRANESLGMKERIIATTTIRINPMEIVSYREHFNDDGEHDNSVTIELKNADNLVGKITITEFEKLINEHQK